MAEGEIQWLVAGLGNPGPEYERTPHNLGFLAVDRLAERHGIRISRKEAMALVGQGRVQGAAVLLAKPQTFMNRSGSSVNGLLAKAGLGPERLILLYDDLDLPWTSLRIRPRGSAGGHKGVQDVIRAVGSSEFPRVRMGIHGGRREGDGARIVLSQFGRLQEKDLDEVVDRAAAAVESIIADGVEMSMTKFNRRAGGLLEEEE
jgi:PTH1 family peptidyl-tRNA hydrolase